MSRQNLSAVFAEGNKLPNDVRELLEAIKIKYDRQYGGLFEKACYAGVSMSSQANDKIRWMVYMMLKNDQVFVESETPNNRVFKWLEQEAYAYKQGENRIAFTDKMFVKLEEWANLDDVPSLALEIGDEPTFEALTR